MGSAHRTIKAPLHGLMTQWMRPTLKLLRDARSGGGRFETDSTVWTFLVRARRE
jgi:hypothetical protein